MKWILVAILVTQSGVTESQSDFATLEECQAAKVHMLKEQEINKDFISLAVKCELVYE